MPLNDSLHGFHPIVREWFTKTFREPSPPQRLGWPSISSGQHTLILAPTGSGKTLAAFLWAINHLVEQHLNERLFPGVRILYISPLKALGNDIFRNLEQPLEGIRKEAQAIGLKLPTIHTAIRTGDTPQAKRQTMLKHPPDILITTPESLYLMLTSKLARKMFHTVQYVILDEIHSLCGNKRGVHLSLSLERLSAVAEQEFVRIGLSATQRPLDRIAAFLGGQTWDGGNLKPREVAIVDAGRKRFMDLRVECAVPDFSLLQQDGVWPLVFTELLENIRQHTTTLIFVNNRRLAERVAAKLNELILELATPVEGIEAERTLAAASAPAVNLHAVPKETKWSTRRITPQSDIQNSEIPLVQAYHGSMSRQAREQMEADLKAGRLRALVATSSLELGIDIGSIDLVIQLQSPKGVARGLQRVGRSGHLISGTSKGRIFPTHREDLVESAVLARSMMSHDVEHTVIPTNCLDVLAQHVAAMVSVEEWDVDELYALVRQSYCYQNLPRQLFVSVLRMLAGRYTHEAFRELRARISWDTVNNSLRALPGTAHLAITNGGTIVDRGHFGVYLENGKTKVGEVDEEFVFESRVGDTFILGTNVWRMVTIDANRLIVVPAPGEPARMPFWRGEGIGRSFELGAQIGAFRREMGQTCESPHCLAWLQQEFPIDSHAAWNIQEYFRKQKDATGVVPDDHTLVVEGFRDEIGDPRIVVHSAYGRRVNGLLGLVLAHRLHEATGVEPQMLYSDNGILLRCSDVDEIPLGLLDNLSLKEAQDLVIQEILASPLFGGQFRQNAARALLMPKGAPGKRTPLWLQRLRAGDLLQIARHFDDFPIVVETTRDVLNDVLDFEHFSHIIAAIEEGKFTINTVHTEYPSPFAKSMLFDFIAVYMYEWDQPKADKLAQYLAINRELLSEILDIESVKGMLRPEAIEAVEAQLQHTADGYKARSPEELFEVLLQLGDLTTDEIRRRILNGNLKMLEELESSGRAIRVPFPDGTRWVVGEDDLLYHSREQHTHTILRRFVQHHGPVTSGTLARRYGVASGTVDTILQDMSLTGEIIKGHFRHANEEQSSDTIEWCYRPNLERIHRQSISILRKEVTPSSLAEFTDFLHHWQGLFPENQRRGIDGVQSCCEILQGLPLHAELWERDILNRRVRDYSRESLSQLTSTGTILWAGAASGKTMIIRRGEGGIFLSRPLSGPESELKEPALRVLRYLRENGASFFGDLRTGTKLSLHALNDGIAELFWSGLITNDVLDEVQNVKRLSRVDTPGPIEPVEILDPQHNPHRGRLMQTVRKAIRQVPGWTGRWSLVHLPAVMGEPLTLEEQAHYQAMQLLRRYGILAREFYRREDLLPWALIATELQRMEMRGEIRRGYFIEGLSGMQFALSTAVEEMRRVRAGNRRQGTPLLLNTCDPANPYGPGIEPPSKSNQLEKLRITRAPANYLVFHRGTPILMIENHGARMWRLAESTTDATLEGLRMFTAMMKLPQSMRPFKEIVIEHCDGQRPAHSPLGEALFSLGFRKDRNQTLRYDGYA